ncbi:TPA: tRNA-intron lyase [Candidatus Woesearchaeota archaeon]|nr:tRNA-intron lyase [Candidatus Woesearchaeota archaeon]HIH32155.1 tRNA-intron lyase [Candidatus Woesearchaeota archaeon]HIH55048.1 tRNA-intron lyase [Candidatus Woesearchaeota archaeon]HIJ02470.1 tRNA-intron lyase [Candidatus Woesearchaeota archaeon]HIJ14650.1 tRNA-intron lyase [Candidatus Woesearchaeota archaeon]
MEDDVIQPDLTKLKVKDIIIDAKPRKEKVKAVFANERVIADVSDESRELFNQSRYGTVLESGKLQLSLLEALYLMEKNKLELRDARNKSLDFESLLKKATKLEPTFWIRYCVFKDMRNRGYIIKTALKFGADFRVYDRGIKPGEDHARWIIYPVHEGSTLTWYEFAAKNRVAHSTKKRLMMGIVDDEGDVTYYEIRWMKP